MLEPANWRPPTEADLPEIESLVRAWDREYRSLDWSSFQHFRDYASGEYFVSRIVVEDRGIVAIGWLAAGYTSTRDVQRNYVFTLPGATHFKPLMQWLDDYRWAPENRRIERILAPGVGLPREHAELYSSLGYAPSYSFVEMHRDLSTPLPELPATDVRVEPWTLGLHEALLPLYNDAFRGDPPLNQEQWDRTEMPGEDFDGVFSHVAFRGDRVAGFALSLLERDTDDWIDPVIAGFGHVRQVVIGDENCGVEAALIDACARSFRQSGIEKMCVQADDEDEAAIYGSLGFEARREFVIWSREAPLGSAWEAPGPTPPSSV